MFGSLGGPELILILVIALIVFGPRRLPDIGKSIGKMLVEFRRASNDFKRTIEDEVEAVKRQEQLAGAAASGDTATAAPPLASPLPEAPAPLPAEAASIPPAEPPAETVARGAGEPGAS